MANIIMNVLRVKNLRLLPLLLDKDENPCMDFQKIIPMPESLDGKLAPANSSLACAATYYMTNRCGISLHCLKKEDKELLKNVIHDSSSACIDNLEILFAIAYDQSLTSLPKGNDAFYERGRRYVDNYVRHGSTTWYDWCYRHWGTKWNASYSCALKSDPDMLYFETAWCPPYPVLKALSQKYPESVIDFSWADEDTDGDAGEAVFAKGECVQMDEYSGDEVKATGIRDTCLAYRAQL